jgi:hypothetical protein
MAFHKLLLTTDFKHRRTAAFENQKLYGQIECAIGGCLQGIVRPIHRHYGLFVTNSVLSKLYAMHDLNAHVFVNR